MFNSMTLTKVGGALAGALLVFLLLNWAADSIYGMTEGAPEGEAAYVIETDNADAPAAPAADAGTQVADILAAGDPAKGAKVFSKCKACHKVEDGVNATGPSLYGVVGRKVGTEAGYSYSATISGLGGNWTPERMFQFLAGPKKYAPGTKMGFAGLKKEKDRANVIAYLASLVPGGAQKTQAAPAPTPAPAPAKKAEAAPAPTPAPTPAPAAAPAVDMAAGDAALGKKVFKRCKACHKLEAGVNAVGPSLYGVVGRDVGTAANYRYSASLQNLGGKWTPENISKFLTKPKAYAPGTKMGFAGLKKEKDRANVIAYLKSVVN